MIYRKDNDHPMSRLRLLLESRGLWHADHERKARQEATAAVRASLANAESNTIIISFMIFNSSTSNGMLLLMINGWIMVV
jgi:TPP-dependent pyruvate/acetoin dehydrogenase alpha subunit